MIAPNLQLGVVLDGLDVVAAGTRPHADERVLTVASTWKPNTLYLFASFFTFGIVQCFDMKQIAIVLPVLLNFLLLLSSV